jgi:hypothetical protein
MSQEPEPRVDRARRSGAGSQVSRSAALRRLSIVTAILTVLAAADALYMQLSGYHAADVNNFHMSDAATVFVAAALLLVLTVVLFVLSARAGQSGDQDSAEGRGH